jgi:uncharacterized protein (TIGR03435 family)
MNCLLRNLVARFRINPLCVAMPGPRLAQRIRQIIAAAPSARISLARAAFIVAACVAICAAFAAITLGHTQGPSGSATANAQPAFDTISIRPNRTGQPGTINLAQAGGHLTARHFSLARLMIEAYNIPTLSQAINTIVGMPGWGTSETLDVDAEVAGNPTIQQKRLMLQALLADRFKLVLHHETRELPVYAVVVVSPGKLGPQIHSHPDDAGCAAAPGASSGAASSSPAALARAQLEKLPCGRVVGGLLVQNDHNQVWSGGRKITMDALAEGIGRMQYIDRPLINATGLTGFFDFTVEWDSRNDDLSAGAASKESELFGYSLLEALRDQLGLKLDSRKGPVDILVIDHVEQPTPN